MAEPGKDKYWSWASQPQEKVNGAQIQQFGGMLQELKDDLDVPLPTSISATTNHHLHQLERKRAMFKLNVNGAVPPSGSKADLLAEEGAFMDQDEMAVIGFQAYQYNQPPLVSSRAGFESV
jgi:hypothetical protein